MLVMNHAMGMSERGDRVHRARPVCHEDNRQQSRREVVHIPMHLSVARPPRSAGPLSDSFGHVLGQDEWTPFRRPLTLSVASRPQATR